MYDRCLRVVEEMGEYLVLFKLDRIVGTPNEKIHIFYNNGRKPPLDISFDSISGEFNYLSFFAQDEKIIEKNIEPLIKYKPLIVSFYDLFHVNETLNIKMDFNLLKSQSDLFLISDEESEFLNAFLLDESVFLLFSEDMNFKGVLFKSLLCSELNEMKKSMII